MVQISINNVTNFSMVGDPKDATTVTAACGGSDCIGFSFVNVSHLNVHDLTFMSDGQSFLARNVQKFHVMNCTFTRNNGIAFVADKSDLVLESNCFEHNSASNKVANQPAPGSAIAILYSNLTLMGNNRFINNTCSGGLCGGSGLYAFSSHVIAKGNSSFVNNSVMDTVSTDLPSTGAGILIGGTTLDIRGQMSIVNNTIRNSYVQINCCEVSGGGVSLIESNLVISGDVLISNNSAEGPSGCGGGISIVAGSLNITGRVTFYNNRAGFYGGGMYSIGPLSDDDITSGTASIINSISRSSAKSCPVSNAYYGGQKYNIGAGAAMEIVLSGTVSVVNNIAGQSGGGFKIAYSKLNVAGNVTCSGNRATGLGPYSTVVTEGGGWDIWHSNVNMPGTLTFTNNTAIQAGGLGIINSEMYASGHITLTANIADRVQGTGGGMIIGSSNVTLGKLSVTDNSAGVEAGGMYAQFSNILVTDTASFANNNAGYIGGGAIIINSIFNCNGTMEFVDNSAAADAGAIDAVRSEITIAGHALITNNTAGSKYGQSDGGGLFLSIQTNLTVLGMMSVINNTADHSGGGIMMERDSRLFIAGRINFNRNHAALLGGAIAVVDTRDCSNTKGAKYLKEECFFKNISTSTNSPLMVFEGNMARTGTVLFGGSVDNCRVNGQPDADSGKVFDAIADYSKQPHSNSLISSLPYKVCLCENNEPRCE